MDFADKIKLIKTEFLNMNSANLAKNSILVGQVYIIGK